MPHDSLNRREFLGTSARNAAGVAAGAMALSERVARASANERVTLGVIGLRNRGREIASALCDLPDARIAAICDVDTKQYGSIVELLESNNRRTPRVETDARRLFDDRELDAVVIATPDHWHAPLATAACAAGKDVYLEVPLGHTVADGTEIVSAAKRENRVVQAGLQHRSGDHFRSAVEHVRGGGIGHVRLARAWATHRRKSIGRSGEVDPPETVDYAAWLGSAPRRPFTPNRYHYNWRWFWDYGSGELGNWGVHLLDLARWGVGVGLPLRVSSTGGRYHFQDDQETPDTQTVAYDFGETTIVWEHRQWSPRGIEGRSAGVAFYGDRGTLIVDRSGWKVYDRRDGERAEGGDSLGPHLRNFLDAVRTRERPTADAGVAHVSTTLCHLGNVSQRIGREVPFDPVTCTCRDDEAQALMG